ncbi:MAG TPA: hypothetical protein DCY94_04675 [Firmicutes bacterium]|nr:hypothetical protein [Bacillota bacterium]
MKTDDLEHLSELKIDDYIWYIYIFIVFAALLSNSIERDYVYTKDKTEFESFRIINIALLTIAFFIYLYFLKVNAHHFEKKRDFTNCLSLIGTIFLLISGSLILIAEIRSASDTPINLGF